MSEKFDSAISVLPERIRNTLTSIPTDIKCKTFEIRIRKGKPLVLFGVYGTAFAGENSIVSHIDSANSIVTSAEELKSAVSAVCDYSVYSHQTDMANGFVTYGGGARVGFCGTAVMSGGRIVSLSNISSMNIRIPSEFDNASDEIMTELYNGNFPKGIIIAGAPCTGKTTILKSIAYKLSSEYKYGFRKCVIVDERFEMSQNRGVNCDILSGYDKETGIVHALRTLSPEVIICDEIATEGEANKIIAGLDSGVCFIVSVHARNKEELLRRSVSSKLIASGCFDYGVILGDSVSPCSVSEIVDLKERMNENNSCNNDTCKLVTDGFNCYSKRKSAL